MDDDDVGVRKLYARICLGQIWIVPFRNVAEEDTCQYLRSKLELRFHARQVISWHNRSQNRWDVKNFKRRGGKLFVAHGAVTGAKIHRFGLKLLNAAAAANRLIIDLNVRVGLVIFAEPFGINRIREGRACSI